MKNVYLTNRVSLSTFAKKWLKLTACLCVFKLLVSCDQKPLPPAPVNVSPTEIKPQDMLSRAIYSAFLQLDPHFVKAVADAAPVRDLLTGLMQFSPTGEVVPAVATATLSEDGKQWLILLDENAKWSNGENVTAYDFVASWQRLADPKNGSPLAHYLVYMGVNNAKAVLNGELPVTELGVRAESSQRLQIELEKANVQLPKMLAHLALLPTYQGKKPEVDQPFISNGAYQVSVRQKLRLTLKARLPDLAFQTVNYQLINTIQNPKRFDIVENPLDSYERDNTKLPRLCTYFYEFNFNDPALNKKEIRQAIRSMISPSEISRNLGIPIHSVLPKTMSLEANRRLPTISAEQIFHQLGIGANKRLQLVLTHDNQAQHKYIAERIARTLAQSDLFMVTTQAVEWKALLAKREAKDFQLIRSGWCADYNDPALFLTPFHSQSLDNKSGYANPKVDELLAQLQQLNIAPTKRDALITEIVSELENDVAILPLFQYQRRLVIDPNIRGVVLGNSSEVIYSKDLYRQ